tara:strand:- start:120730 stop:122784 length:2055 start_codon:yes stop_codon:yes gene_type:complete
MRIVRDLLRSSVIVMAALLYVSTSLADGPEDNDPQDVRPVPARGIQVDSDRQAELLHRCQAIRAQLAQVQADGKWLPHVEVFPRAVEMTLHTRMVYSPKDLKAADQLLDEAERRLVALREGRTSEILRGLGNPRLLVGGFRSRMDGSVQPFGLELPEVHDEIRAGEPVPFRLDVWLHGRGEKSSEVSFLNQRSHQTSQYSPANTIVLHPYGRYSNAFKFAGEIDVLEAIEQVKSLFPIDQQRIAIRGFSMGGAGCWQLAVHYPDLWAAANPGAGFSETLQFLKFFQLEDFKPTWYQQKLLRWYDCPGWTNNLRNVPTIAYSGEIDRQKQAADVMVAAFQSRGMNLPHVIGPDTAHKIHPDSKIDVQAKMDAHLDAGKVPFPSSIDMTTYTLRYHKLAWLSIDGLDEHWKEARVQGNVNRGSGHGETITLSTRNVSRVSIAFPPGALAAGRDVQLLIDQSRFSLTSQSDGSFEIGFTKSTDSKWIASLPETAETAGLAKRPGLQGPIDDAFMDAFTFVGPDLSDTESVVGKRIDAEFRHAKDEWVRHFRGDVVEAKSSEVTDAMIATRNLILFGTPETNSLIAKIVDRLPIRWHDNQIQVGDQTFRGNHVPLLIYPNPLNPDRYIVINSGFTYREYAYLNNARQIPMLPDWAIVDVSSGSTTQLPGEVKAAGFFDEQWQLKQTDP